MADYTDGGAALRPCRFRRFFLKKKRKNSLPQTAPLHMLRRYFLPPRRCRRQISWAAPCLASTSDSRSGRRHTIVFYTTRPSIPRVNYDPSSKCETIRPPHLQTQLFRPTISITHQKSTRSDLRPSPNAKSSALKTTAGSSS